MVFGSYVVGTHLPATLQNNHIYTSGATGTNAAVIRGALRAEKPDLLTVVLPQSRSKQPADSQELLEQVACASCSGACMLAGTGVHQRAECRLPTVVHASPQHAARPRLWTSCRGGISELLHAGSQALLEQMVLEWGGGSCWPCAFPV